MLDKMVQNDVTGRDVLYVAYVGRLPMPQGGPGGAPREFFLQI